MTTTRREWMQMTMGMLALGTPALAAQLKPVSSGIDIEIWKTPTCGCCSLWVDHMRGNGFRPRVMDVNDTSPFRKKAGVPEALSSCHTAIVSGYALEGHVPADVVHQMLKQRPKIVGIAVPGMPMGSPGMEGGRKDKYDVVAFDKAGKTSVFAQR